MTDEEASSLGQGGCVRVRRMQLDDVDRAMDIAGSLKGAPHWPRTAYTTAICQGAAPRRIALVAENEVTGALVGFAVAGLVLPQAELETIAVAAEAQRHGVGNRLFSVLIDEIKAAGATEFILEVRASNDTALAFYRQRGWSETGRRPRYYAEPEEDAVLMRLRLE
jgi:ribosomal-protein-alanine N-acetyltransferase